MLCSGRNSNAADVVVPLGAQVHGHLAAAARLVLHAIADTELPRLLRRRRLVLKAPTIYSG